MAKKEGPPPFPFPPYPIQASFMASLQDCLRRRRIGIFESPTGTGKTLSVLCGSLAWLRDHYRLHDAGVLSDGEEGDGDGGDAGDGAVSAGAGDVPAWLSDGTTRAMNALAARRAAVMEAAEARRAVMERVRKKEVSPPPSPSCAKRRRQHVNPAEASARVGTQILLCTRTHSQLTQVVEALKSTVWGGGGPLPRPDPVRFVVLGSRRRLCINPEVKAIKSDAALNDACAKLAEGSGEAAGCAFKKLAPMKQVATDALHGVLDIEELVSAGTAHGGCPYYASREAIQAAELVAMPYSMLLHSGTRESLGLRLRDSVVIIDEAHNLADAVTASHSVTVSRAQLEAAAGQLKAYADRPGGRRKGQRELEELGSVLEALIGRLAPGAGEDVVMQDWLSFVAESPALTTCSVGTLVDFLKRRALPRVLRGMAMRDTAGAPPSLTGAMMQVEAFLAAVSQDSVGRGEAGPWRVLVDRGHTPDGRSPRLKVCLLSPSEAFAPVVKAARSVVLVGGTMKPVGLVKKQLFPSVPDGRFAEFECGHVMPEANLLGLVVARRPSGEPFRFTFADRKKPGLLHDLVEAVAAVAAAVPGGVVVFLPSYHFLDEVAEELGRRRRGRGAFPRCFMEQRGAADSAKALADYERAVKEGGGGNTVVLLCVVGAKLSEGINFKDDLARCVVVVGMPFPNKADKELAARKAHLGGDGALYYKGLCMKAVNQSIGRAIRHKDDYAAIVLLDERYRAADNLRDLPAWIRASIDVGRGVGSLAAFFTSRREAYATR